MSMFSWNLLFDHFQLTLIHGPNIPGSHAILFVIASNFTSITSHIHNWVLFLFWLHLFILSGVISPLISSSIWAPTDLRSSSFSFLSFCIFILLMGLLRQEYWSGLPFPSPVDHVLSEFSTVTCQSWVALHGMAHSFIELDKAAVSWWWYSESVLNNLLTECVLWGEERNQTWLQGSGKDEVWKVYWSVKGFGRSMLESGVEGRWRPQECFAILIFEMSIILPSGDN